MHWILLDVGLQGTCYIGPTGLPAMYMCFGPAYGCLLGCYHNVHKQDVLLFSCQLNYRFGRRPANVPYNVRERSLRYVPHECSVNVHGERPEDNFPNVPHERPLKVPGTLKPNGPM